MWVALRKRGLGLGSTEALTSRSGSAIIAEELQAEVSQRRQGWASEGGSCKISRDWEHRRLKPLIKLYKQGRSSSVCLRRRIGRWAFTWPRTREQLSHNQGCREFCEPYTAGRAKGKVWPRTTPKHFRQTNDKQVVTPRQHWIPTASSLF